MEAEIGTLFLLPQPKEGQQQILKQKITRTARKSNSMEADNQGIKEETFIQTDRRGGYGQPGWRGLTARRRLEEWGG